MQQPEINVSTCIRWPLAVLSLQVQGAISQLVDAVMVQVREASRQRQRQQLLQQQVGKSSISTAEESTWAVMNPPMWITWDTSSSGGSSSSSRDPQAAGAAAVLSSCYYYSPASVGQLSDIYGRARAILQPPPPPAEPRKGEADM
jgi:hypothetical protein